MKNNKGKQLSLSNESEIESEVDLNDDDFLDLLDEDFGSNFEQSDRFIIFYPAFLGISFV